MIFTKSTDAQRSFEFMYYYVGSILLILFIFMRSQRKTVPSICFRQSQNFLLNMQFKIEFYVSFYLYFSAILNKFKTQTWHQKEIYWIIAFLGNPLSARNVNLEAKKLFLKPHSNFLLKQSFLKVLKKKILSKVSKQLKPYVSQSLQILI